MNSGELDRSLAHNACAAVWVITRNKKVRLQAVVDEGVIVV